MPPTREPNYVSITANPTLTGYGAELINSSALVIGLAASWASNLRKIATLSGAYGVPDIPKGTISVTCLIPPTGLLSPVPVNCLDTPTVAAAEYGCPIVLDLNGVAYEDTYHTGGSLGTQDFGEGIRGLTITKIFAVFGRATTDV